MIEAELRERLKLKYAGDCKCGHCALVPDDLVRRAADRLKATQYVLVHIATMDVYTREGEEAPHETMRRLAREVAEQEAA
jgi:hypothetical protein